MKIIGVVFVVLSAGAMGFHVSGSLRRRCGLLERLRAALMMLKNEIFYQATPLPKAFGRIAAASEGEISILFAKMAGAMESRCWLTPQSAMQQALKEVQVLRKEDKLPLILTELSGKLGRYDTDSQLQAIELCLTQLDEERQTAERERSVKSKTYETLGICAGLAVAILLL